MEMNTHGWSGGDPNDVTAWTLVRAFHLVARVFGGTLAPHGLTPQQFGVLIELVQRPGQSQAALARAVLATPQSVGELLRVMEDRGLVERTPPAGPGHPAKVRASATGRRLLDHVTPLVLDAVSPSALGLDEDDSQRLNADLHAIIAALGK
jgi:DNA-binding MarR family transcriptional regulator